MIDNLINIGDKVYVGGLFGDDFSEVNNKIGKVNKITFTSQNNFSTYIMDVIIDDFITQININFLYKIFDDDEIKINHSQHFSGAMGNPLTYYFRLFNVIDHTFALDDMGRAMLFCETKFNDTVMLNITNFN